MIDSQLKSKIANTISKYEQKCDKLRQDVSLLRAAMGQLLNIPSGIYVDLDKQLSSLQNDLASGESPETIIQRIETVMLAMDKLKQQQIETKDSKQLPQVLCKNITRSLLSLIEHLKIPDAFHGELYRLKIKLNKALDFDVLPEVITDLNKIMLDTFALEKKQFKSMLHLFTRQLSDVDQYIAFAGRTQQQAQKDSRQLETGIKSNIKDIKKQVDDSSSIEELASGIYTNLEKIAEGVKTFKHKEQKRIDSYEKKVAKLKAQLAEAKKHSETIQQRFNAQQQLVSHDALTGLPNRMTYDDFFLQAYNRWERGSGDLCLALADIDYFKIVNDTHGHLAGDKVLQKLAKLFQQAVRKVDFVARYGGEEFVFIFENTKQNAAVKVLETIRQKVEACEFIYKGKPFEVTVSFGLTMLTPEDSLEECFTRADNALYKAKREGRNQVQAL